MNKPACFVAVAVGAVFSSASLADVFFVDDDVCPDPGGGTEADPFCSIQDAIDAAVDTDEIIVAPGTYFETINFLGKAVTLRSSDGPGVTIIDAQGSGTVVTCNTGEGPGTVLDGFVITGGDSPFGGGLLNVFSSPTVTNCTFLGNSESGMRNIGGFGPANPTVTNCTFLGNVAVSDGGGMFNDASSPTVTDCTFVGNSATGDGGGMYNTGGSNPTVTNCTFSSNSAFDNGGAGMYNGNDSNPTVISCTFDGNSAGDHGGGRRSASR